MAKFKKADSPRAGLCIFCCAILLALLITTAPGFAKEENSLAGAEQYKPESPVEGNGWAHIYDPTNNSMQVLPYAVIDSMAVYQGDIILGPVDAFESPSPPANPLIQQGVATQSLGKRWDDGIVFYNLNGHSRSAEILDAMSYLEDNTSIRFAERASESNFVTFQSSGGCSSFIGRIGGSQDIQIGSGCSSRGVISHEIFHALGVYHEQSRSDRDNYVTINFGNIRAGKEGNFRIATNAFDIGSYNYNSIMHYRANAFTSNGSPTIVTRPPGISIGNRAALSTGDIETIQYLYYTDLQLGLNVVSQASPGTNVQLNINIANRGDTIIGNIIAKDVKVSIPLPLQSGYVDFSSVDSWSCQQVSQTVECSLAVLERNSTSSLSITLTTPDSLNSMIVAPVVTASNRDIQTNNNSESATISISNLTTTDVGVDVSLSKGGIGGTKTGIKVGESFTVNLVVDNSGSSVAQLVRLNLATFPEMRYSGFNGNGWSCSHSKSNTTCTLASLGIATSSSLSIDFDAVGALDSANFSAEVSTQNADGDLSNNFDSEPIRISNASQPTSTGSGSGSGALDIWLLVILSLVTACGKFSRLRRK